MCMFKWLNGVLPSIKGPILQFYYVRRRNSKVVVRRNWATDFRRVALEMVGHALTMVGTYPRLGGVAKFAG